MSTGRLRRVRKLRSKSALIPGYSPKDKAAGSVRPHLCTTRSSRSPSRTRGRVSEEREVRDEPEWPEGGIAGAAGRDHVGIALADPQLGTGRLLQRRKSACVVEVRVRVEQHFDVSDVEPEFGDARHDHRGGPGIAAVDQDVALGPGEQERSDVVGTDVIEVPGDAERFGGLLSTVVAHFFPFDDENHGSHCKSGRDSHQDFLLQALPSFFRSTSPRGSCLAGARVKPEAPRLRESAGAQSAGKKTPIR